MSSDSSAEMTVGQHDQTAIATSPGVPTAHAEDPAQDAGQRPAAPDEQSVLIESNGHAEANGNDLPTDTAAEPVAVAPAADRPPMPITPDVERPAFGPRILGVAEPVKPLPSKKAAAPARKPRRRRPSAAERHRRAFFAALTDLRRGGGSEDSPSPPAEPAVDEASLAVPAEMPQAEARPEQATTPAAPEAAVQTESAEVPVVAVASEPPAESEVAASEAPAESEDVAPQAPAEPEALVSEAPAEPEALVPEAPAEPQSPAETETPQSDHSATSPARLTAAIEHVGGPEVIKEALKPKQDEKGQPLKWAAVCAQAAEGVKPGDPVFNAWVRLAATPVREVKGSLPRPPEQARPAARDSGRRSGGQRTGDGARRDRGRRDDRPSRQEYASHAHDGTLRKSVRIVTGHDEDQERRERERVRKEQREAKRRAERERLARLGY